MHKWRPEVNILCLSQSLPHLQAQALHWIWSSPFWLSWLTVSPEDLVPVLLWTQVVMSSCSVGLRASELLSYGLTANTALWGFSLAPCLNLLIQSSLFSAKSTTKAPAQPSEALRPTPQPHWTAESHENWMNASSQWTQRVAVLTFTFD